MTLDEMIQESIETWKPLEFKKEDLNSARYKLVSWTSIEIEMEINRLWELWYVPMGWISCVCTSHWLVYAQLMENLYYNFTKDDTRMDFTEDETRMDDESSGEKGVRDSYPEWWTPISWGDKGDDWLEPILA